MNVECRPRPLRALLAAHFAATRAFTRRALGMPGRVAQTLYIAFFALTIGVPIIGGLGAIGYLSAAGAPQGQARVLPLAAGMLVWFVVFAAVLTGMYGGARRLSC